jgi:hypothetical protein
MISLLSGTAVIKAASIFRFLGPILCPLEAKEEEGSWTGLPFSHKTLNDTAHYLLSLEWLPSQKITCKNGKTTEVLITKRCHWAL